MQMNRSSFRAGVMSSSRSKIPRAANSRRSLVVQARQNMAGERIWLDVVWLEDKASPEAALSFFVAQSSAMDGVFDPFERRDFSASASLSPRALSFSSQALVFLAPRLV